MVRTAGFPLKFSEKLVYNYYIQFIHSMSKNGRKKMQRKSNVYCIIIRDIHMYR
jgi:hypothetical protein